MYGSDRCCQKVTRNLVGRKAVHIQSKTGFHSLSQHKWTFSDENLHRFRHYICYLRYNGRQNTSVKRSFFLHFLHLKNLPDAGGVFMRGLLPVCRHLHPLYRFILFIQTSQNHVGIPNIYCQNHCSPHVKMNKPDKFSSLPPTGRYSKGGTPKRLFSFASLYDPLLLVCFYLQPAAFAGSSFTARKIRITTGVSATLIPNSTRKFRPINVVRKTSRRLLPVPSAS